MTKLPFIKKALKKGLAASFLMLSFGLLFGQTITTNTQGTHDGFFYSFWTERSNDGASMTLGPAGNYSTRWNNTLNFTAGKGWKTGSGNRVVCFEGTYDGGSNGFLALYGWTQNPLIEYYVCEKHGAWEPPGNTSGVSYKGTYTCDGGTYKVYTGRRENKPSIVGNASFDQYWSVRVEQRSSGTITFADHMKAWQSFGMRMGTTWDYQIMESEGYTSSGSSNITVRECSSSGGGGGGQVTPTTTVKITGPAATTPLIAPASVQITAQASITSGSISKVEFYNGRTKLGEDNSAPYSYTWNNVAKGSYSITAVAIDNTGKSTTSEAFTVKVNVPQGPYKGTAHAIPGTIQFEDFDEGGNGTAYYDLSAGTSVDPAPNFRSDEDVDIENCSDNGGGYNLGWTEVTEWTEYTVNVQNAGTYTMELRVACEGTGRTITVASGNTTLSSNIAIPNTGGWQVWETVTKEVELRAGEQVLRFTIGGTDYVNMNYVKFTAKPTDLCPNDPNKTEPGVCGCGTPDVDTDKDGTLDCEDDCPNDPNKTAPGECGCGVEDKDSDNDGTVDCKDECPNDSQKTLPGECGCGVPEGTCSQQEDLCPDDPNKTLPGECGCGVADVDSDKDGVADCKDKCPNDPNKTAPGACGCGTPEGSCSQPQGAIILKKGWNLIGYPIQGSANIEDALAEIWENVEVIKDLDSFFSKGNPDFINGLTEFKWGMGYNVYVTKDCELNW